MMRVILVRHAIAYERSRTRWPKDSLRPLTPAGKRRFRKAARGLRRLIPRSAVLLTSPFVRARDTAVLLSKVAKLRKPRECSELAARQPAQRVLEMLKGLKAKCVVLVGHEPDLSVLMSKALADQRLRIEFRKGGAACLDFPGGLAPHRATLVWMLPPRVLRALG
jgi:phosphohistidine phosphatase